jgi:hypothetical protein
MCLVCKDPPEGGLRRKTAPLLNKQCFSMYITVSDLSFRLAHAPGGHLFLKCAAGCHGHTSLAFRGVPYRQACRTMSGRSGCDGALGVPAANTVWRRSGSDSMCGGPDAPLAMWAHSAWCA